MGKLKVECMSKRQKKCNDAKQGSNMASCASIGFSVDCILAAG